MKTKQRKNMVLRISGIALLFTLISTCLLSGTIARYVSMDGGDNHARVAKWGVNIEFDSSANGLFQTQYAAGVAAFEGGFSVQSGGDGSECIIAPGTDGWSSFSITGMPEVAVEVNFSASGSGFKGDWDDYYPIVWTLKKGDEPIILKKSLDEVFEELNGMSSVHGPNTDLESLYGTYTIIWEWPLGESAAACDSDTYVGNMAVAGDAEEIPVVDFNFWIHVGQID